MPCSPGSLDASSVDVSGEDVHADNNDDVTAVIKTTENIKDDFFIGNLIYRLGYKDILLRLCYQLVILAIISVACLFMRMLLFM